MSTSKKLSKLQAYSQSLNETLGKLSMHRATIDTIQPSELTIEWGALKAIPYYKPLAIIEKRFNIYVCASHYMNKKYGIGLFAGYISSIDQVSYESLQSIRDTAHRLTNEIEDLINKQVEENNTNIQNLKDIMENPNKFKTAVTTATTKVRHTATDVADSTLNGVHFVAITVANIAEAAKCRLHRDEDPEDIKKDMMMSTCMKQQIILLTAREARAKFRKSIKTTTAEVSQSTEELPKVMTLTVADFQQLN